MTARARTVHAPATVSILGVPFTLKWVKPGESMGPDVPSEHQTSAYGACLSHSNEILIREGMSWYLTRQTLLHEILHAVTGVSLNKDRFEGEHDNGNEEVIVDILSTGLTVAFGDPILLDFLKG